MTKKKPLIFWLLFIIITLAAVALRAVMFGSFPLNPDEGIHLIWLRLLSAGYAPYREVYITYPPLYPLMIDAVWRVWPGEAVQRWFSVVYAIFGVLGVTLLARSFAGRVAALGAAALLLFSPVLIMPSLMVMGEFYAVAWAVWAIWAAWLYREAKRGRRALAVVSGLCLAASLLTKLLLPFVALLIPLMMLTRRPPGEPPDQPYSLWRWLRAGPRPAWAALRPLFIDGVVWGLALLLPVLLLLVVYDVGPLVQQVVGQRLDARIAYEEAQTYWELRQKYLAQFWAEDALLILLALAGAAAAWRQRLKDNWIMLAWAGLALLMLLLHNPVRYKHFLILLPPFAIWGGVALSWLAQRARRAFLAAPGRRPPTAHRWGVAGLAALLALLLAWQARTVWAWWQSYAAIPDPPPGELEALDFIEQVTAPGDCLITDDMQLAYWSGRMVPPELAEVSSNRLISGALALEELAAITDRYDCQVVAAVANRIPKYLPRYTDWVKQKYLGRFHYGEDDIYVAKADTDPRPAVPLWANLADEFIFHGYTLPPQPVSPGSRTPLTLVWQAQTRPPTDYTIFVQLRDAAQNTLASADHQPFNWLAPTSKWPAGAVIQETAWLELPADIPPGEYPIYVGLYRADTLERLPIAGDTSGENALVLGPLVVR